MPFVVAVIGAIAQSYSAGKQSDSAIGAAQLQSDAATRAGDLSAKAAEDALSFSKATEAERQREWEATQQKNYQIYLDQQKRMQPYRNMGLGALAQMGQPIPQMPASQPVIPPVGTLGALAGAR